MDHKLLSKTSQPYFLNIKERALIVKPQQKDILRMSALGSGFNENTNGLLKKNYPKGTNLSIQSQSQLNSLA
jgi:hypothetical protein